MSRRLDFEIRRQILQGAAEVPCAIHPAWRSQEDSGLYAELLRVAKATLKGSTSFEDAEDILMAAMGAGGLFIKVGEAMSRKPESVWLQPPSSLATTTGLATVWIRRKAISARATDRRHDEILTHFEPSTPDVPSLAAFILDEMHTRTPLGLRLAAFFRSVAEKFGGVSGRVLHQWLEVFLTGDGDNNLTAMGDALGLSWGTVHATRRRYLAAVAEALSGTTSPMPEAADRHLLSVLFPSR